MGSDADVVSAVAVAGISIHAPRVGSDTTGDDGKATEIIFQSTLPAWGATTSPSGQARDRRISIHAPRVGSDVCRQLLHIGVADFNPRSPRGERRVTQPVRAQPIDISIHAPRVGSDVRLRTIDSRRKISIHAPRVGSDVALSNLHKAHRISIHAPRVGSDEPKGGTAQSRADFNPRSPRGERRKTSDTSLGSPRFQSTLPAWGATRHDGRTAADRKISIHAPRVGSDVTA